MALRGLIDDLGEGVARDQPRPNQSAGRVQAVIQLIFKVDKNRLIPDFATQDRRRGRETHLAQGQPALQPPPVWSESDAFPCIPELPSISLPGLPAVSRATEP